MSTQPRRARNGAFGARKKDIAGESGFRRHRQYEGNTPLGNHNRLGLREQRVSPPLG